MRRFGGLDVAIANAGIHIEGALATMDPEKVERVLEVNLLGVWRTDRAVLSHVIERRGYLLNISSLSALVNVPLMGPYAASKAGVEALTNVLRMELASTGARVGCAYFGFIDTDLVRDAFAAPSARLMRQSLPSFVSQPAVNAIERAIARRSGTRVGAALRAGGIPGTRAAGAAVRTTGDGLPGARRVARPSPPGHPQPSENARADGRRRRGRAALRPSPDGP